ncbi:MAG TPA: hypothetical protein PLT64_08135 [Syntrophales bacterium]|nr:hypothetical protein [Syntrophales bacterium]HOL59811.1 hypothetical protein [Syntrophales bacterium]HPO35971.1 hypothetical protein [Syntrophales bacterium]
MPQGDGIIYQDSFPVEGGNFETAGQVSGRIKAILKNLNLPKEIIRRATLVAYESEINIVSYATRGEIKLIVKPEEVIVEADDIGPGIEDIELAMQAGYSTANEKIREMGFGAGMGLFNINTYSDIFKISSEVGKGTHLHMVVKVNEKEPNEIN